MDTWKFTTFLACAVLVFILASCVYRRHVRRPALLAWALGMLIAGVIVQDVSDFLRPQIILGGMASGSSFPTAAMLSTQQGNGASMVLLAVGRMIVYASLPRVLAACLGGRGPSAYPQCSACGYNLTGSTGGTCPECGRCLPGVAPPGDEAATGS